ncbi:MAG: aldo/keto reductase [Chloroflexi bacterium]|nr:aldo/keto reductase [Chloroflexota bacterium]
MEKRRFGRTGHMSSVVILGTAAFGKVTQEDADTAMELALAHGVNHIDIAPSYGDAELRVGPWMPQIRNRVFLGCKTTQRTADDSRRELEASLKRLQTDKLDLYQMHAVNDMENLDMAFAKGGAIETFLKAREEGLTRYLGITGHGWQAPVVYQEALRRFDFDSVLFPINFVLYAHQEYRAAAEKLLQMTQQRDLGVMIIKSIAQMPWGDQERTYRTWYKPFDDQPHIDAGVRFALSQPVTGICSAGDVHLLPKVIEAGEKFVPMPAEEQEALIASGGEFAPIFP